MTVYFIAMRTSEVRDQAAMEEYQRRTRQLSGQYQLIPKVVYGETESLEGCAPDGTIILEFLSKEEALAWYNQPDYQEAIPFRQKAADYDVFIVDGK